MKVRYFWGLWLLTLFLFCEEPIFPSDGTGFIKVSSTPQGMDVYLDDSLTGSKTNCIISDVPVGKHNVRLSLTDYMPFEKEVEVKKDDTVEVSASMKLNYTMLYVQSEPKGAAIWLDGFYSGKRTDYFFKGLGEGEHDIRLVYTGYPDWDTTVNLSKGDSVTVNAFLVPNTGMIEIRSTPSGASVYLDDSLTGSKTNTTLTFVAVGKHTVRLVLENYFDWEAEVEVKAAQTSTLDAVLEDILLWRYGTGDFVRSSPAVGSDGTVYFGSYTNRLYALYKTGVLRWSFETEFLVESSPALGPDGVIYFGSYDNYTYALSPSGGMKWRYGSSADVTCSPAIGSDGTVYIGMSARLPVTQEMVDYLYAIAPDSVLRWRYEIGREGGYRITASPVVALDGTIYFASENHYLYAVDPSGSLKWRFKADQALESSPAVGPDGTVYFGSHDKNVYALSPSGDLVWKFPTQGVVSAPPVIGPDGCVYIGSNDGCFYAIDASGNLKWMFNAVRPVQSAAAIGSDTTIYFGTLDGYLYALDCNGILKWRYKTDGCVFSSPAIGSDGTLYVGSHDGYLYALKTRSQGLMNSPWPKFHHDNQNTGRSR